MIFDSFFKKSPQQKNAAIDPFDSLLTTLSNMTYLLNGLNIILYMYSTKLGNFANFLNVTFLQRKGIISMNVCDKLLSNSDDEL